MAEEEKQDGPKRFPARRVFSSSLPLKDARDALEGNARYISSEKQPLLWNLNSAAIALCDSLSALRDDVEIVQRKLDQLIALVSAER